VEDELNISNLVKTHLEREGHQCFQSFNGLDAIDDFHRWKPDLIILDLMLPGQNGFEVCKTIREKHDTYILMLTAKQEEIDRVLGLEMGADDYVIKPFSIRELLARVRALFRRPRQISDPSGNATPSINIDNLEIRPDRMEVLLDNQPVSFTALEFDLLYFLMTNVGIVFKREHLLERVWGKESDIYDRSIDRIISQIRKKIEIDPVNPEKLITIWGVGYKFVQNS
jgi:DNA-binding response OmpR family regulator